MPGIDVLNRNGEKVSQVDLADEVFNVDVKPSVLHEVVTMQLASRRSGTAAVKRRSDVRGSGKKLFRQKGTGRARRGDIKSPLLRGGGVTFGPSPRSYGYTVPKKVRKLALKSALSAKMADGKLVVLESADLDSGKTGELAKKLAGLGWGTALVVDGAAVNENFARAARNIVGVDVLPQIGANVYDILRRDTLVLTKDAVEKLVERLK